jgi:hypothetical protein
MFGIPPVLFGAPGKGFTDAGGERDWAILICVWRGVNRDVRPGVRVPSLGHPVNGEVRAINPGGRRSRTCSKVRH